MNAAGVEVSLPQPCFLWLSLRCSMDVVLARSDSRRSCIASQIVLVDDLIDQELASHLSTLLVDGVQCNGKCFVAKPNDNNCHSLFQL